MTDTSTASAAAPPARSRSTAMSWFVALVGAWFLATAFLWTRTAAGRWNAAAVAVWNGVALGIVLLLVPFADRALGEEA